MRGVNQHPWTSAASAETLDQKSHISVIALVHATLQTGTQQPVVYTHAGCAQTETLPLANVLRESSKKPHGLVFINI